MTFDVCFTETDNTGWKVYAVGKNEQWNSKVLMKFTQMHASHTLWFCWCPEHSAGGRSCPGTARYREQRQWPVHWQTSGWSLLEEQSCKKKKYPWTDVKVHMQDVQWLSISCFEEDKNLHRYRTIKESLTWPSGRSTFQECSGEFCWADRSQSTLLVPPPFCLEGLIKYTNITFCSAS